MTAEEYRKAFPKTHQLEVAPGITFKVRRVGRVTLLARGLIPSFLVNEVGRNWRRQMGGQEPAAPEVDDQRELMLVILAVVCEAAVEPRLVQSEPQEGELNIFEDVADDHIMAIFNWCMHGSAGVPVSAKGGEVALDDLVSFHAPGERDSADDARPDGADVRSAPVADARPA